MDNAEIVIAIGFSYNGILDFSGVDPDDIAYLSKCCESLEEFFTNPDMLPNTTGVHKLECETRTVEEDLWFEITKVTTEWLPTKGE